MNNPNNKQIATFGAGCFWKTENEFINVSGVIKTSVGYMGGDFPHPSYLDVVARITGHAEVAQVEYDTTVIGYEELLQIFWQMHDPTSLNRQGADRGEQYRSVIFYHTSEQEQIARRSKQQLQQSKIFAQDIVTEIKPAKEYYLATEDHQQYFQLRHKK
ncbi:peptide-methionine (S)-S-oxide reductase [Pleurocapsa sp. CCALA 161]|uniref:peptide-methionine (S)-S-oxide reductase MsrA n=1 Tax=Pleurocapsa sp. CCALA 161 TaxID=2107688 RepID=UPI000D04CD02|nr:peptide-methionine (S)-S-oxide reductase MsrA [Pleurocapsa sp. CCALA 161]PSB11002.1 peptide-methionine (S)-S-oxide reductase [Pleurocapsa sp. CCALA 161]